MSATVHHLPVANQGQTLTKKQLAAHLGRSERWVELRMREGLPAEARTDRQGRRLFSLAKVQAWLEDGKPRPSTAVERLSALEARVAALEAELRRVS